MKNRYEPIYIKAQSDFLAAEKTGDLERLMGVEPTELLQNIVDI